MNELLEETLTKVPGLVLGRSVMGKRTILAKGNRQVFGIDAPLEMSSETSFDLGSITKILATTASLMRLVENGELSLDDKAAKFLNEWSGTEKEAITVRDLLLHRSGLWEWRPLYIDFQDPTAVVKKIGAIPLRYPINRGRHYSDLGFIALGQILIKISGDDLRKTVDDLVFEPLGMNETQFGSSASDSHDTAATSFGDSIERTMVTSKTPYPVPEDTSHFKKWRNYVLVGEVNDGNSFHLFDGVSGHAGLFSCANDLLQFGETMIASFRGEGSYSQKVIQEFLTGGPDQFQQLGFRSWSDTYEGCRSEFFGHTGFPGTVLAFSPSHEFVATLLTNRLHVEGDPTPTEELWRPILSELHGLLH